jgi:hypothetical protein
VSSQPSSYLSATSAFVGMLLLGQGCMIDGWPEMVVYTVTCESGAIIHRDKLGNEASKRSCLNDEVCIEISEYEAVCRLESKCEDPPAPGLCEENTKLIICSPADGHLARIDCSPGRCEPNTTAGARCVDQDAIPCSETQCDGTDVLHCINGFTLRSKACPASPAYAAGICRKNSDGALVCAQPEADACDGTYVEHCEGDAALRCSAGFVWKHDCPTNMRCALKDYGGTKLPVCGE